MESCSSATSQDPFLRWNSLGLLCTSSWHEVGHPWFFRPVEPLILGWKQSARASEEQRYPYTDACRADLEQGALGPILMAA